MNRVEELKEELKKVNKQLAQHKYHHTELGRLKIERNNERRRFKTVHKKIMKELLESTQL